MSKSFLNDAPLLAHLSNTPVVGLRLYTQLDIDFIASSILVSRFRFNILTFRGTHLIISIRVIMIFGYFEMRRRVVW
jgi:hypothetical protein